MVRNTPSALSRRQFLHASAAGLAALSGPFASEQRENTFGEFLVGVHSYSFRDFDTEGALKLTRGLGLHGIEFYDKHASTNSSPEQVQTLLKLCQGYDIAPFAFGVQRFSKDHDQNRKLFEFGKALGIRAFSADPDPGSLDSLDKLCDEFKIPIGIHPHGSSGDSLHRWHSAEVILAAVKNHHPLIGACLDTGHLIRLAQPPLRRKVDPAGQVRIMGARNFGLHLKDHDNTKKADVILGQGSLDVHAVLRALRDVGFKGPISIATGDSPKDPSPVLKSCLEVFRESVKKLS